MRTILAFSNFLFKIPIFLWKIVNDNNADWEYFGVKSLYKMNNDNWFFLTGTQSFFECADQYYDS